MPEIQRTTTINVGKKTVDVVRATKTSKAGKQYKNHWVLDYSNVSDEQLYSLATRGVVIDLQREFRVAKPAERDALMDKKIDVGAFLTEQRARGPIDRKAAAVRVMQDMTVDELREALAGRDISIK